MAQLNPTKLLKLNNVLQGITCAGSLVSPRVVLSAYHCAVPIRSRSRRPCDHSDGERLAVLGLHEYRPWRLEDYKTIPIIKALYPPHAGVRKHEYDSHDFVLFVLSSPAKYSTTVSPICLPRSNAEYSGAKAVAAGWGRTHKPSISPWPSPVLKAVRLTVSRKKYKHKKIFGTILSKKEDLYQDPCAGDSGDFTAVLFHL